MSVVNWNKPARLNTPAVHAAMHEFDSGPPGGYVPNMSEEDARTWRGKLIGGNDPRVELRKTIGHTQVVVVVRLTTKFGQNIEMSANGRIQLSFSDMDEMQQVIAEAKQKLNETVQ